VYEIDAGEKVQGDTKIMKSTISKIVDDLNDEFCPIFEEFSGMMFKIRTEKNQVKKAYNFLKRVSEGHNKVIRIKIHLMN
jgi:hypothetical protein